MMSDAAMPPSQASGMTGRTRRWRRRRGPPPRLGRADRAESLRKLRTPLAVTQTLLEVARSDAHRDDGQLVERLQAVNTRAIDLIRADHAGVGLGLAIIKSIAQAHDGTLTLTPRAAGGLCVTVQLAAAPPHPGGR
jgi:hypothetical protein